MRLCYEHLTAEHAQALFPALADPAVYQHIDDPPPTTPDELAARFERMSGGPPPHRADESWWNFAVRLRETGLAVGRLEATIVGGRAEVAYLFGQAYWGHGYATEALGWLHQQLRERTVAATFWATARPENARSIRLLLRSGYAEVNEWPPLTSYDPGDVVYSRRATAG